MQRQMYATSPTLAQMRSINGVTVRGSTTVNMPRDLDDALQVNAFVDVWQQIHALWRCDERCPSNNVDGVCWRNAAFQADGSRYLRVPGKLKGLHQTVPHNPSSAGSKVGPLPGNSPYQVQHPPRRRYSTNTYILMRLTNIPDR